MALSILTQGLGSFGSSGKVLTQGLISAAAVPTVSVSVSGIEVEARQTRIVIASGLTRIALRAEGARVVSQARRED